MSEEVYIATGRRKASVARIRLTLGEGKQVINGRPAKDYLCRESLLIHINQPIEAVEGTGKYDVLVNVTGGGLTGQAGAVRLGIARALVAMDPDLRPALKSKGYLSRDSRIVERKKYGQPGARKRFQFSKR